MFGILSAPSFFMNFASSVLDNSYSKGILSAAVVEV